MRGRTDREVAGLRGPVRKMTLTRRLPHGTFTDTLTYSWDGRLIHRRYRGADGSVVEGDPPPGPAVVTAEDGSYEEIAEVPGVDSYGLSSLPLAMGIPVRGAARVRTRYDAQGVPREVLAETGRGEVTARALLLSDERGNIIELRQYGGAKPVIQLRWYEKLMLRQADKKKFAAFLQPEGLETRTLFTYDERGRLSRVRTLLGDETIQEQKFRYNEQGDKAVVSSAGEPDVHFQYEYDSRGNWILERVHHREGMDESRRTIVYYDEACP